MTRKCITWHDYYDKVLAGWYGKFIGGTIGAPYEGDKRCSSDEGVEKFNIDIEPNDDSDFQIVWLSALEKYGPLLTSADLRDMWMEHIWYPFGEYSYAVKNFRMGVQPSASGSFNNAYFKEGMGCLIRSEIWGFISPGLSNRAAAYARIDGCLDHGDEAVWAEQFFAAMVADAFFERDVRKLIDGSLEYIPAVSRIGKVISFVRERTDSKDSCADIRKEILRHFGHPDATNCIQNAGFIALALLRGTDSFENCMRIALNCGYDSDCTCATAGAIYAMINGLDSIPADWICKLNNTYSIGVDITRKSNKISDLAYDTCVIGLEVLDHFSNGHVIVSSKPATISVQKSHSSTPTVIEASYDQPVLYRSKWQRFTLSFSPDSLSVPAAVDLRKLDEKTYECKLKEGQEIFKSHYKVAVKKDGQSLDIGLATARRWQVAGPFWKAGVRPDCDDRQYWPHGDKMTLPVLQDMFTNAADIDDSYIDERKWLEAIGNDTPYKADFEFESAEDLVPFDNAIGFYGPNCIYAWTELYMTEAGKRWLVIGSNNQFKCWFNGNEIGREEKPGMWMPSQYCITADFNKGRNVMAVKLVRSDLRYMFSFGIKEYEFKHAWQSHWAIDVGCFEGAKLI
ncbi:MAG: ADP-ribosylglycohydrolase family protein [bacterium]|jgi:ADP-ribosylglycohydrolase